MPLSIGLLVFGFLVTTVIAVTLLIWGVSNRLVQKTDSGQSTSSEATDHRAAIFVGGSTLLSLFITLGCLVLLALAAVIGWFVFVRWAFKDFSLF
jgi:hypothetical protein